MKVTTLQNLSWIFKLIYAAQQDGMLVEATIEQRIKTLMIEWPAKSIVLFGKTYQSRDIA